MEYQTTSITKSSVEYMYNGAVCVFTLHPRLLTHTQGAEHIRDHYDDHLISEEQFDELEKLLFDRSTNFRVLLVLSPLPVLRGDPDSDEFSVQTSRQVRYCKSEIVRLLDCLSLWLEYVDLQAEEADADEEEDSSLAASGSATTSRVRGGRQAAIISGGSNMGYRTLVEARRKIERRGGESVDQAPAATIQQVCCGSFISIPESTPDTADDEDQCKIGSVTRDTSFTAKSRYDYIEYSYKLLHSEGVLRAHCGVVDIDGATSGTTPRILTSLPDRDTFRTLAFGYSRDLAFRRSFPPLIPAIWSEAKTILAAMESADVDGLPENCSDDLREALSRISEIYHENESIGDEVHARFCSNTYGLPTTGGRLVEEIFLSTTADLVREMHSSSSSLDTFLIRSPSPIVVTMIWSEFRATFDYSGSQKHEDQGTLLDQLATSALISSKKLFLAFELKLIYMPIILEDLSYEAGLIFDE